MKLQLATPEWRKGSERTFMSQLFLVTTWLSKYRSAQSNVNIRLTKQNLSGSLIYPNCRARPAADELGKMYLVEIRMIQEEH
jgi:hypothetical protein